LVILQRKLAQAAAPSSFFSFRAFLAFRYFFSVYSALQYGHFAAPDFSMAKYTRGCEFHRCMPGIGQASGRSAAVTS
jgi:uncharacterized MnhB-related membrane protein